MGCPRRRFNSWKVALKRSQGRNLGAIRLIYSVRCELVGDSVICPKQLVDSHLMPTDWELINDLFDLLFLNKSYLA